MQAALAMGLGTALLVMWIVGSAMRLTSSGLLTMVLVILGTGVYLTAITIDDPQWWRVSFSYLGKLESNVNFIFNGTLIFAGILLLVWRSYFLSDFRVAVRHGAGAERWAVWLGYALIWLAIGLMIVGIFKSRLNPFSSIMHNLAAYSLAGVFAVLMATTRWTVPRYPREFHLLSLALVVVLLATLASRALACGQHRGARDCRLHARVDLACAVCAQHRIGGGPPGARCLSAVAPATRPIPAIPCLPCTSAAPIQRGRL